MWPLLQVLLAWTFGPPSLPLLLPLALLPLLPLQLTLSFLPPESAALFLYLHTQLPPWLSPLLLLNVNRIDPYLLSMFICMTAFVGRIDRNLRTVMRHLEDGK
jgi:hypothetical protein